MRNERQFMLQNNIENKLKINQQTNFEKMKNDQNIVILKIDETTFEF